MEVAHFYHVYAAGEWVEPLVDHLFAIGHSPFVDPVMYCVLVGSPEQRARARKTLLYAAPVECHIVAEYNVGWEQHTLRWTAEYAQSHDGAVFYAHTKGAHNPQDGFAGRWRRSMTRRLLDDWQDNVAALEQVDAVGSHWLSPEEYGWNGVTTPFFGGNFWLARCDYLRKLPPCPMKSRWDAERWIGLGNPTVRDLLPGWPGDDRWPELCG